METSKPIAETPAAPYYSVIFTSRRAVGDDDAYATTADRMLELAAQQDGFLGVESVRDAGRVGITVSYWRDLHSIRNWHAVAEHRDAQTMGRSRWYDCFSVRNCRVERDYKFDREAESPLDMRTGVEPG